MNPTPQKQRVMDALVRACEKERPGPYCALYPKAPWRAGPLTWQVRSHIPDMQANVLRRYLHELVTLGLAMEVPTRGGATRWWTEKRLIADKEAKS